MECHEKASPYHMPNVLCPPIYQTDDLFLRDEMDGGRPWKYKQRRGYRGRTFRYHYFTTCRHSFPIIPEKQQKQQAQKKPIKSKLTVWFYWLDVWRPQPDLNRRYRSQRPVTVTVRPTIPRGADAWLMFAGWWTQSFQSPGKRIPACRPFKKERTSSSAPPFRPRKEMSC